MENIEGTVERIIYSSETDGYTVFSLMCRGTEIVCVGTAPSLDEGEYISAKGSYTEHSVYGRQFRFSDLQIKTPEDEAAIERYLGSGAVKGIGPSLAARITGRFKTDTFRIIEEEPERLAEVKGISERKAMDIYRQFHEKQDMRRAMMFLAGYGIPTSLSARIYKEYGDDMYRVIRENPYQLAEDMNGVGFKQADAIAEKAGIGPYSDFRIRSGCLYTLNQGVQSGHTYLPEDMLVERTARMLGVDCGFVSDQLQGLQMDRKIVVKTLGEETVIYSPAYYRMELETAAMLMRLGVSMQADEINIGRMLERIEEDEEIRLDDLQRHAVFEAMNHGVLVITGGPGTGKTTTINAIIKYFGYEGMSILLAAPTGRAAKRMTEATGCEAQTIHRMLELAGSPDGKAERGTGQEIRFERNEEHPLEADAVIIDEMSMVDISLMNALLKAIPEGTRLILVGDVDQLPSVGPGNVLKDIIDSGAFPVVRLTRIFRQAMESRIIINAHMINEGKQIELDNTDPEFFCLKRYDAKKIQEVLIALVRDKLPGHVNAGPCDIQVLTPMRKGELGVERLNTVLQQYLNPPSLEKNEKEFGKNIFREGDKVMQIRNDYQLEWTVSGGNGFVTEKGVGVFNGDIGIITGISMFAEEITVEFDERRCVTYAFSQSDELELAYAVTVHKAQGSEYPAVILPILTGPKLLFNRNILYTAVTRAKQCVVIVGDDRMVRRMIDNESQQKRYTSLDTRIQEMIR